MNLAEGLTARPASPGDIDAVTELIAACELDLDGAAEVDRADLVMDFGRVGFEPARDCVLVFDGAALVGWASVHQARADADVRPSHRGRGIGSALLSWTEDRAHAVEAPAIYQVVTDADAAAAGLFASAGYAPTQTAWVLQIRSDDGPPPAPEPPEGIDIRPYRPGVDERAVYRLIEDAFNEWPGRPPQAFEQWVARYPRHPLFSPECSPLAFDGDEIVGAAIYLDYRDEGWVQQLATKATHRHRGIARALLHHTFGEAYASGKRACGLSTNSNTGALALYEKVGMHVRRSYTRFTKTL